MQTQDTTMNATDINDDTIAVNQTSDFDFTVEQVPFHTPEGQPTRFLANRRTDTGAILGICTEQYEVLQNSTLFSAVETMLANKELGGYKRKVVATGDGARVRAIYDFPNMGIKLKNGNDLTFRMKVQNSFDRSLRASLQVGMVRLICSNGLAAPVGAVGMTRKHTSGLEPELVETAFVRCVESFGNATAVFNEMIDFRVSQRDGNRILLGLEGSKVMSERVRKGIAEVWDGPTFKEDSDRNLFNLYNAVTQHLTHNVETKRFELAERVSTGTLNAFTKAVQNRTVEWMLEAGDKVAALN